MAMTRYDQGRPTCTAMSRVTARKTITFVTRRHFGVLSSKWPKRMLPTAKIVAARATSNQESMARGVEIELNHGGRVCQHAIDDAGWWRQLMERDSACVLNVPYLV